MMVRNGIMFMRGGRMRLLLPIRNMRLMFGVIGIAVMMVKAWRIVVPRNGIFHVAGERIGKMRVIVRVIDLVHQRDVGLRRQHGGERHADHSDNASEKNQVGPAHKTPRQYQRSQKV